MRRIVLGGVLGGLPGLLIAVVPLLMHEVGLITADQSQIGFVGVPLLFVGVFAGTVIGASQAAHIGQVMLGVTLGFVVGLAAGVGLDAALASLGSSIAGVWLLLTSAAMIAGAALGARWSQHAASGRRASR